MLPRSNESKERWVTSYNHSLTLAKLSQIRVLAKLGQVSQVQSWWGFKYRAQNNFSACRFQLQDKTEFFTVKTFFHDGFELGEKWISCFRNSSFSSWRLRFFSFFFFGGGVISSGTAKEKYLSQAFDLSQTFSHSKLLRLVTYNVSQMWGLHIFKNSVPGQNLFSSWRFRAPRIKWTNKIFGPQINFYTWQFRASVALGHTLGLFWI